MTQIINLIPEECKDSAHNALAYCKDGIDVIGGYEKIAEIADGRIIVKRDYWCNYTIGETEVTTKAEPEIVINCMWCGGNTRLIYAVGTVFSPAHNARPADDLATDEPQHGINGYCRKCHSYCWGDCEAN